MTGMLAVTVADLKRLCGMEAGDVSPDEELGALLAAQQPALEYGLDPAILAASAGDAGLRATLTLGVAEVVAGEWLGRRARAPGVLDDFHIGPLSVTASRTDSPARQGERLAAQGLRRLEPFVRASRTVGGAAAGGAGDGSGKGPLLASAPTGPSVFDAPLFDWPCGETSSALENGL